MRKIRTLRLRSFAAPWELFRGRIQPKGSVLLESARPETSGSFSILAERPERILRCDDADGFQRLRRAFRKFRAASAEPVPPFGSGAIGFFSYEYMEAFERSVKFAPPLANTIPRLYFAFYDRSIVWDHARDEMILCSASGEPDSALRSWEKRLRHQALRGRAMRFRPGYLRGLKIEQSMDRQDFTRAVRSIQRRIRQGDIFQANLTHRLRFRLDAKLLPRVYDAMRRVNPSPFFGYLDAGDFQILSGSPERLVKLSARDLSTRPIAGTRRRGRTRKEDQKLASELLLSDKERAEHIMLVDLERNDLGRVSEYGSVAVDELMQIEDYSHVKHIVSNVRGRLRSGLDGFDAIKAFFPGGTITGAPKISSVRILRDTETVPRGPYTGSLGYFGSTGDMDFNILIRSLFVKDGWAMLHVGAGIVADSDPDKEYDETLHKAKGVLRALIGPRELERFMAERGVTAGVP